MARPARLELTTFWPATISGLAWLLQGTEVCVLSGGVIEVLNYCGTMLCQMCVRPVSGAGPRCLMRTQMMAAAAAQKESDTLPLPPGFCQPAAAAGSQPSTI